ncbi:MAG: hypothetical protein JWP12_637 [Bacteroidetes bacterium]|nr:hypothetical protein [Bacteroidota bacterium]
MKKIYILAALLFIAISGFAQTAPNTAFAHRAFPQEKITAEIKKAFEHSSAAPASATTAVKPDGKSNSGQAIRKMDEVKKMNWNRYKHPGTSRSLDTVYVGVVPHDTLVITGTYNHTGPIFVFNDGVLIFYNATATNYGDVYLFEHGRLLGLNSSLTFPQTYFYQRSLIVVQNGLAYFNNCSFNYSGVQHSLVVGDSGAVGMESVHQADWTTAGLYGHATIQIHGLNLGGEYILDDSSTSAFSNVDTLLLWHQLPNTAVINYAFPQGDTVMNYAFNNTVPGVSGIQYNVNVDSCHTVWWAMMPVNGSNVTISNSNIRAIGTWFQYGDTATANGIFDNTFYPNVVIPLSDRNLHLLNSFVQTWNLYVFDSSQLNITNCTVGEVGTQQKASIYSQQFLLDGSGGYFWATDTSVIFGSGVTIYSTARSERTGIFILSYSDLPFAPVSSIGTSLMISVQNTQPTDPTPFDGSIMWLENIESPATTHADSIVPVRGSAWIDQGPAGSWMDYGSYSLYYQLQGDPAWTPIVIDSTIEIRHNVLGMWNTTGLIAGNYNVRLLVKNDLTDSVEDIKVVTVLPGVSTGLANTDLLPVSIYPNPASDQLMVYVPASTAKTEIRIYNLLGENKIVETTNRLQSFVNVANLAAGVYTIEVKCGNKISRQKFVKQ